MSPDPEHDELEALLAEARGQADGDLSSPDTSAPAADASEALLTQMEATLRAAQAAAPAAPPRDGLLALRTASILSARYVDLKLADLGGTLILLLQAPLVGFLLSLAFEGEAEDRSLHFTLAMIAVWFGTFNACREVVKERPIFLRERRAGVPVRAYLLSKLGVLALLAALQCLALVLLVARTARFETALPLVFASLLLTALAGTGLGLLLSSLVKSQNSLIALVPIALIPQLIFSPTLIPTPSGVVVGLQKATLAYWGLEALVELRRTTTDWGALLGAFGAQGLAAVGCVLLAGIALRISGEE